MTKTIDYPQRIHSEIDNSFENKWYTVMALKALKALVYEIGKRPMS